MSKKTKKGKLPKTKIRKSSIDLLDFAVTNVIMYMEIEKDAKAILIRNRQLTAFLNVKLQIEMAFCANILKNLFKVSGAEILRIADKLRADEQWDEEIESFVDSVSPGSTKKIRLFNEGDFKSELVNQERTKKGDGKLKTGKLII